jgi:large subunit ribosomal protein L13
MQRNTHTIDAKDKSPGRLATKVASLLRGKHKRDFVPHIDMGDFVVIENVSEMKITGKKLEQKKYYHHSGYLGGLKERPLKKLFKEKI